MTSRRWTRAIAEALPAALGAAIAALPLYAAADAPAQTTQTAAAVVADPNSLQNLSNLLLVPGQTPANRAAAASRLAADRSDSAAGILTQALSANDPEIETAAAKALSETDWIDPGFVAPLEGLLGPSQTLDAYAADALSQYAGENDADAIAEKLEGAATSDQIPAASRAPIVRSLGAFGQRPVAQTLIDLLQNPAEGDEVRQAAAVALAEMTGLNEFGQDVRKWQSWWQSVSNLPPDDLAALMQRQRGTHYAQMVRQSDRLGRSLDRLLKSLYFTSPATEQARVLSSYLMNDAPEVRGIGAEIVEIDVSSGRPMRPESRAKLLEMVAADPAPFVRSAAAGALALDPTAAGALYDRLSKETNPDVLAALLNALAARQDSRAITAATRFLRDASPLVAQAAADSLAAAGPALRDPKSAALRQYVETALLAALDQASPVTEPSLRRSVVSALAALGDMNLYDRFVQLAAASEPEMVRVEAIGGLGVLAQSNPDIAAVLADFVDTPGTPTALRLKAVQVLASVPTTAYVDRLVDRLNRTPDPDPDVRQAVWQTVQAWLAPLGDDRISRLAERLKSERDYEHEVQLRRYYVQQLDQRNASDAAQMAASQRETIASRELDELHLPSQAAADFAVVANYYLAKTRPGDDLPHNPFLSEAASLLAAGPPYDAAVQYAADTLADPKRLAVVPDVLEQYPRVAQQLATNNTNDRTSLNNALLLIKTFNDAKLKIPQSLSYVTDNMQAADDAAKQNLANLSPASQP